MLKSNKEKKDDKVISKKKDDKVISQKSEIKTLLIPVLIITIICLVSVTILVATHEITKPIIEANDAKRADIARSEVFSKAGPQGFSEVPEEELLKLFKNKVPEGLVNVYVANNNEGMVITTEDKGFGGSIIVVTGIDKNGEITGITITDHTETPGLGTKAMTADFLSQYMGKTIIDSSADASKDEAIDAVTGATISSNAIFRAVDKALLSYEKLGGVPSEFK